MRVRHKTFKSSWSSWGKLFREAAAFATTIGPQRLINISHSVGGIDGGVVTVWYWDEEEESVPEEKREATPERERSDADSRIRGSIEE